MGGRSEMSRNSDTNEDISQGVRKQAGSLKRTENYDNIPNISLYVHVSV